MKKLLLVLLVLSVSTISCEKEELPIDYNDNIELNIIGTWVIYKFGVEENGLPITTFTPNECQEKSRYRYLSNYTYHIVEYNKDCVRSLSVKPFFITENIIYYGTTNEPNFIEMLDRDTIYIKKIEHNTNGSPTGRFYYRYYTRFNEN